MPELRIPQLFRGGFNGPPTPPNDTDAGCPVWENIRLVGEGKAFTEFPGYARALQYELELINRFNTFYPRDDSKRFFLFDASVVYGMPGIGIAIVDYANNPSRTLSIDYLKDADPSMVTDPDTGTTWEPGTKPILMLHSEDDEGTALPIPALNKVGPHEYPTIIPYKDKAHIFDEKSLPLTFDGIRLRETGIRPPGMAPNPGLVEIDSVVIDLADSSFVTTANSEITIGFQGDAPRAATTVNYARVSVGTDYLAIANRTSTGDEVLCFHNRTRAFIAENTRMRLNFMLEGINRVLPAGTINFVMSDEAYGGTGDFANADIMPIDIPIQSGVWYTVSLTRAQEYLTVESIGFQAIGRLPEDLFTYGGVDAMAFRFQAITSFESLAGPFTGDMRAFFTWYDSVTRLESSPSPISQTITMAGETLQLSLGGYRGYMDEDPLTYAEDPGAGNKLFNATDMPGLVDPDSVRIYLSKTAWGLDASGGAVWRLAGEVLLESLTGEGAGFRTNAFPFTVAASIGQHGEMDADNPPVALTIHIDDSSDLLSNPETADISADKLFESVARTSSNTGTFWAGTWPSTLTNVLDKDRIVGFGQEDFRVAQVSVINGSDICTLVPGATGAKFLPSFVGRSIIFKDNSVDSDGNRTDYKKYTILQWFDDTRVRISRNFEARTLRWGELYAGTTGTYDYVIKGITNRVWYSTNLIRGPQPEYVAPTSFFNLPMPQDELIGGGHAGEYLILCGRRNVFRILQRPTVDDLFDPPYIRPELLHGSPGMVARRTFTQFPSGGAGWLGFGNNLIVGNAVGFKAHPLSEKVRGYLTRKFGKDVTVSDLAQSHAVYLPGEQIWIMHFIPATGASDQTVALTGSALDTTAVDPDFTLALAIDFKHGTVYPLAGYPFTTTFTASSPFYRLGEANDRLFAGSVDGRIMEFGDDDMYSLGVPKGHTVMRYAVSVIAGATITIVPGGFNLPTDGDGLAGLPIRLHKQLSDSIQDRVISANDADTITTSAAFSPVAEVGDIITLAPLDWKVVFQENRLKNNMSVSRLSVDLQLEDLT